MDAQSYMRQIEQALGDLDGLRRLRSSVKADGDLSDTQRAQVLGRVDGYLADEARAAATDADGAPDLIEPGGQG